MSFNNHFAGFGPQSTNEFLKLMNKPEIDWNEALQQQQQQVSSTSIADKTQQQTSISDFTHY
jgi:hypothetical protein